MIEFEFEPSASPWDLALSRLKSGQTLSARRFLALVESSEELSAEDAALELESRGVMLDITDLPRVSANPETQTRLELEKRMLERGSLMDDLQPSDPLRLCIQEIMALPAVEDGGDLARKGAAGDESAMRRFSDGYLAYVVECAKTYAGQGVLLMDLIQEGSLGLWQGILSYQDGSFQDHVSWWIRQAMARAVVLQAQANGVGQNLAQQMSGYRKADQQLLTRLHRNPTELEISQEMGITLEESVTLGKMLREIQALAKMDPAQTGEPQSNEDEQAVEDTAYFQQRQRIDDMLTGLDEQEARLIRLRYGLDGKLPMTAQEAAAELSMTVDEVVAMETLALGKMRRGEEKENGE